MPRVSTFCPRCGESIETEVPDAARAAGRAELTCPACRFDFVIAPARRPGEAPQGAETFVPAGTARSTDPAAGEADGADPDHQGPEGFAAPQAHDSAVVPQADHRAAPSFKPVAAAMMLLFAALIAGWVGGTFAFEPDLALIAFTDSPGSGNFSGMVVEPGGDPVANVTVTIVSAVAGEGTLETRNGTLHPEDMVGRTTTSDAEGHYAFGEMPLGVYEFRFEAPGHRTVLLEAPAYGGEYAALFDASGAFGRVEMPTGDPARTEHESTISFFEHVAMGLGWFLLTMAALALAGAVAAILRRGFPLALVGCVAGILSFFAFLVGAFVSVLALVLIIMARREFRPLVRRGAPEPEPEPETGRFG